MSEVKWIKITTDIFDDEKILLIESMPDPYAIIVVWFKLLCLAGKQNNSGVFLLNDRIAYTDTMLATIFRMNETTVRLALKTFEQFGMIEIIDGVITIPNWNKHQSLDQLESRKEYMRNYMKSRRDKQKLIAEQAVNNDEDLHKANSKVNSKVNVNTPDKEKDKDKEKNKKSSLERIVSDSDLDTEVKYTIYDFIDMRKLIKAPMTDRAITLLINKLKEMASDPATQIAILNQSIENSWKGIFPLRDSRKPGNNLKSNWNINRDSTQQYQTKPDTEQGEDFYQYITRKAMEGVN